MTSAPGSPRFYRPELDALRFLAFAMVLVHHIMPIGADQYIPWSSHPNVRFLLDRLQSAAGFGLSLFFCLSAYLIGSLLLREKERTGTIHLKAFYIRRILRIWPLYLTALILGFIRSYSSNMRHYPGAFAAYLLLAGNWYCGVYGFPMNPILPLWSISVEEQFYLFIPVSVKRGGARMLALVSVVLYLLFLLSGIILAHVHAKQDTIWTNSFVQFSTFASGLVLAIWLKHRSGPATSLSLQLMNGILAIALLVASAIFFNPNGDGPPITWIALIGGYGLVSIASALFIYAVLQRPWTPPVFLVYLGKVSFGLYVFHSWAIGLAKAILAKHVISSHDSISYSLCMLLVAFGISLALASLSYRFLESPFLRMKDKFSFIHSRPI